jgi:choline kinase
VKAVILNSGTGSRMGHLTDNKPKCLVPLKDDDTILSRQIRMLLEAGVKDILITIGPYENMIPDYVKNLFPELQAAFVRNELYETTNYIYSMYLADSLEREDILLLHGDIVLEKKVLDQILSREGNSVLIDSTLPLPEKDFKGRMSGGFIREIGTAIKGEENVVFLLPVYSLNKDFMEQWMDEIGEFVRRGETQVYAENAFNAISGNLELCGLDIRGGFCMEVDTIGDLNIARERV